MNVNKKLDRFRQWGMEKVGAAGDKTQVGDDFKLLETEMNVRHEGMEKLHGSAGAYVKALARKTESDGRDKYTPIGMLGAHMVRHANDFEDGNRFGSCLLAYGQANQQIARLQDTYAQAATSSIVEGSERALSQMKDCQTARKKLDSRRLAYDAAQAKAQKARRDDFRADDELRAQKLKYDESVEDVSRRMQDIIEAEASNAADLSSMLDAQLAFHESARDALLAARRAAFENTHPSAAAARRPGTSPGSGTALSRMLSQTTNDEDDLAALPPPPPPRPRSRAPSGASPSPLSRTVSADTGAIRTATATAPAMASPFAAPRPPAPWTDSPGSDVASDDGTAYTGASSASSAFASRNGSAVALPAFAAGNGSPLAALGGVPTPLSTGNGAGVFIGKKGPPPPPPSRKTKPAPPPPPPGAMRKMVSASVVPRV